MKGLQISGNNSEGDFFPICAVGILAALSGKSVEEECASILEQEQEMREHARLVCTVEDK